MKLRELFGKVNPNQVFIGNIRKCTKFKQHTSFSSSMYIGDALIGCDSFGHIETDDELYKENAVLLKFENGGYVDIDDLNSFIDFFRAYGCITKNGYRLGNIMLSTGCLKEGSLFVDQHSIRPYYDKNEEKDEVSVYQIKKEY